MKTVRFYCREIGAAVLIVLVLEMLSRGVFRPIIGSPLYFTTMISFYRTLMLCLVFLALFTAVPSLRPYREIFLFLSVFVLGYFAAEVLYRSFHPKLSLMYRSSPQILTLYHLDYFFIHRLYQFIPLLFLGLLFKSYPRGYFIQYLRWGDWNAVCDTRHLITGKQKSRTWREISLFFLAILACGLIIFAVMTYLFNVPPRIAKPIGAGGVLPLLSAIFLYAVTAAIVEESFFRGFFLSLFSKVMGDEKGNIYQALIFGALHIDITSPIRSAVKLIVFSFIGWLWGKAAKETGGIGCSLMMHFGVLIALELRVYFLM
jgi:hypothetical protein